jgi:hypothetical protein
MHRANADISGSDHVELQPWLAASDLPVPEGIREPRLNLGGIDGGSIDSQRVSTGQRADIIKAMDVVGMGVGYEHGIEARQTDAQALQPEFGAGIDQYALVAIAFDKYR